MKVVLIYPPFCTPTVMPYSITYLKSFLSTNTKIKIKCIDLNAKFHKKKFNDLYQRLEKSKSKLNSYSELLEEYYSRAKKVHRENNLEIIKGNEPEFFNEFLKKILDEKPDVVGISVVYNSQIFYTLKLSEELSKKGIICIAGGPAVNKDIEKKVKVFKNEVELLNFLTKKKEHKQTDTIDFSDYDVNDYLSKEMIFPLRSSYGCFYKMCAFCTHHNNVAYREIDLEGIKKSIIKNKIKNLFFIDDTISAKRLSELADVLKPLNVRWWCQTRPTKDLFGLFPKLKESGLVSVSFGVESGNQNILNIIRKGTKVENVETVLRESHEAGIKNIVFIMFGFPGENKKTFLDTMKFLEKNRDYLDIVSASVFGLQQGSYVYENPDVFGVYDICIKKNLLGESVDYKVKKGLDEKSSKEMKETLLKKIREINKMPKIFCLLKEQTVLSW